MPFTNIVVKDSNGLEDPSPNCVCSLARLGRTSGRSTEAPGFRQRSGISQGGSEAAWLHRYELSGNQKCAEPLQVCSCWRAAVTWTAMLLPSALGDTLEEW